MKLKSRAGFAVAAIIAACGGQVNKPAPPDMTPKHEGAGGAPAATEAETGGLLFPPGGSPNLNPTSPAKIETCFGTCSDLPKGGLMFASGCAMATPTL